MALNIKNAEAERLARRIAKRTGKSITRVLIDALRAEEATASLAPPSRLRERPAGNDPEMVGRASSALYARLMALTDEMAARGSGDRTDPDTIIGYDDNGVPR